MGGGQMTNGKWHWRASGEMVHGDQALKNCNIRTKLKIFYLLGVLSSWSSWSRGNESGEFFSL